ncbi:MAG: AAA family ATPase [Bacteroidales bacterium]|nr:AAA family ATPase [Bacteroidales bacterium]
MTKKYPIGIQSFEKIIAEGYLYIDKTDFVYNLAHIGNIYFLSRPRRFGKSLLLSTIEAYFLGKKELFKGLKIDKLEKEWIKYPVLHLDFNAERYKTTKDVDLIINRHLNLWEDVYGKNEREISHSDRLIGILQRAKEKTGRQVVVLVDEYDKPMLQVMHDAAMLDEYRNIFKGFYGVFKTADPYLKFVFLTGVTKFGKVSVFSDLNNLNDISMWSEVEDVCGITKDEMLNNFDEDIHELGKNNDLNYEETCQELKLWYDGYHFCEDSEGIYNPFSLLNVFQKKRFQDYWFATGTPTFLVNMLKKGNYNMIDVEKTEMFGSEISKITVDSGDPVQILYQSGYLTIKSYDKSTDLFTLGFPNTEVKNSFYKCLAPVFLETPEHEFNFISIAIRKTLQKNDIDGFMNVMENFLPKIPYFFHANQKTDERHFQEIFYILLLSAGLISRVEEYSALGRSDIIAESDVSVFVFELKMDKPVEEALRQIEDKAYIEQYKVTNKNLYAIGVSFNSGKRCVEDYVFKIIK